MKKTKIPSSILRFIDYLQEYGFSQEGLKHMPERLAMKLLQFMEWEQDGTLVDFEYYIDCEIPECGDSHWNTENALFDVLADLMIEHYTTSQGE